MITVPDRCILLVEVDTMTSRRVISVVAGGADISVENVRWVTMCVCVCVCWWRLIERVLLCVSILLIHDRFRAGETERDAPLIAVVSRRVVAY